MANTLLTPDEITYEALRILHQKTIFINKMDRQYDDRFAVEGAKIGDTLRIRLPNEYVVRTGRVANFQDTSERSIDLTVATQKGVDTEFTSRDLTMDMDNFSRRILLPAMTRLAAELEKDAFNMLKDVYNAVGTPGTTPQTQLVVLQAGQKLDEFLAPEEPRCLIVNPAANAQMVNALSSLFNSQRKIEKQYEKGVMALDTLGFDWYRSTHIPAWTTGSDHTTVTVNGASQTGSTLTVAGGNVTDGSVFTIANVNAVHPETKQDLGYAKQFVVTADATTSWTISPAIITSGAYQNVSAGPADGAAITVAGTASTSYVSNIAFHPEAFTFVTADMEMPSGTDMASRQEYEGTSLRFVRDYDVTNDRFLARFDVLFGYKTLRPELACRIWGE
jgi:hypothetical protein